MDDTALAIQLSGKRLQNGLKEPIGAGPHHMTIILHSTIRNAYPESMMCILRGQEIYLALPSHLLDKPLRDKNGTIGDLTLRQ